MDQKFEVLLTFRKDPTDPPLTLARRIFADLKGCTVLTAILEEEGGIWRLSVSLTCNAIDRPITRHELRLFLSIITDQLGEGVSLEDVRQRSIAKVEQTVALHLTRERG
jgi:hypothetical protein